MNVFDYNEKEAGAKLLETIDITKQIEYDTNRTKYIKMEKNGNNLFFLNGKDIYVTDLQNTTKYSLDYQKITGEKDMLSNGISIVDDNIFILLYKIYEFDVLRHIFLNKRIIIKCNKEFSLFTTYMEDISSDLIFYDLSYYKSANSFITYSRKIKSFSGGLDYNLKTFKELKLNEINQKNNFVDRSNDYTIPFSELYSISIKDDIYLYSKSSLYKGFVCTKVIIINLNNSSENISDDDYKEIILDFLLIKPNVIYDILWDNEFIWILLQNKDDVNKVDLVKLKPL